MRVAIVTETFLPKMDGIVRMLTELLGYLRHQGHEALVIAPGSGPTEHNSFPVRRIRGVRWHVYPGLTLASPAPRQLTATLRRWQPDIVHLAGPVLLGTQAALAARALGLPLAAHFQTDLANYATWHGVPFLRRAAWSYLRTVHRLSDRTYCPTPSMRRQLQGEGFQNLRSADVAWIPPNSTPPGAATPSAPRCSAPVRTTTPRSSPMSAASRQRRTWRRWWRLPKRGPNCHC